MNSRTLVHNIAVAISLSIIVSVVLAVSDPNLLAPHFYIVSEFLAEDDWTASTAVKEQFVAEMISQFSEQELYQTVLDLQNFQTRIYGYPGNTAAAEYLYNRLDAIAGLNVEYQGGNLRNVIATLPGADASSNEIYIVGAHYDSYSSDPSDAPGATDNAAGVAIVLEFARIMSQYPFNHTIKFACWNAEESGFLGSGNYAAYASSNSLNISLYINLDSSAYDPNNRFILDIMYNTQSAWAANILTEHNTLYEMGFALTYNVHTCGSDHRSFWQYGYTAVMTHEETHGPAHTPDDTVDKVSTLYTKKNGQLCMSLLARVAEVLEIEGHDVQIQNLIPSKTVFARGTPITISVITRNKGSYPETFTVTTKANTQQLNQTQITLNPRTSKTFTFTWNTTNFAENNYNLSAYAEPVQDETYTADNTYICEVSIVAIAGDLDNDEEVSLLDAILFANAFGSRPTHPNWNPNCDLIEDGQIDIFDAMIISRNFGKAGT